MNLSEEVELEDYVNRSDKISSAEIASICQEAGMQAVRQNRYVILSKDFDEAYKKCVKKGEKEQAFYS
jgi:26S proteasome regulatory subunit T3